MPPASATPCRHFARGNCRYGANCRFSHEAGKTGGDAPRNVEATSSRPPATVGYGDSDNTPGLIWSSAWTTPTPATTATEDGESGSRQTARCSGRGRGRGRGPRATAPQADRPPPQQQSSTPRTTGVLTRSSVVSHGPPSSSPERKPNTGRRSKHFAGRSSAARRPRSPRARHTPAHHPSPPTLYTPPSYAASKELLFARGAGDWDLSRLQAPGLRSIAFAADFGVTDAHLAAITTLRETLCSSLECLYAGAGTLPSPAPPPTHLTDAGVTAFLSACPALRVLALGGASALSHAVVAYAATHCPRLEMLCVTGTAGQPGHVATAAALKWLHENPHEAPQLRRVVLVDHRVKIELGDDDVARDEEEEEEEEAVRLSEARGGVEVVVGATVDGGSTGESVRTFYNGRLLAEGMLAGTDLWCSGKTEHTSGFLRRVDETAGGIGSETEDTHGDRILAIFDDPNGGGHGVGGGKVYWVAVDCDDDEEEKEAEEDEEEEPYIDDDEDGGGSDRDAGFDSGVEDEVMQGLLRDGYELSFAVAVANEMRHARMNGEL